MGATQDVTPMSGGKVHHLFNPEGATGEPVTPLAVLEDPCPEFAEAPDRCGHCRATADMETRCRRCPFLSPADILALPLRSECHGLVVSQRSWSRAASLSPAAVKAADEGDPQALTVALGAPESVTLTSDGRDANPGVWCEGHNDAVSGDVRYERWTANGRIAHGYVCPVITCRRLVQSG